MKFRIRGMGRGLCLATLMLCAQALAQIEGMEITGFRVPEYNEQGEMTSQLFGEHAVMGADELVKIEGLRLEFYRDGDVFLHAESAHCFYDRENGLAYSEAPVRAEMDGLLMTGTGFEMQASNRTVHVLNDSRVEIDDVMQQTDLGLEDDSRDDGNDGDSTNLTVITSTELFLDYSGRSAKFVDTVHVADSKIEMDADSLEVKFGENNEIDWIQAQTGVRILSDGREAYADKAVYDIETDEFVLEGNPKLVDGENTLFGDRIRFWRASEKMVCEPGARLVIHPDEDMDATELLKTP